MTYSQNAVIFAAEISARCHWLGSERVAPQVSSATPQVETSIKSAAFKFGSKTECLERRMHFVGPDKESIQGVLASRSQRTSAF